MPDSYGEHRNAATAVDDVAHMQMGEPRGIPLISMQRGSLCTVMTTRMIVGRFYEVPAGLMHDNMSMDRKRKEPDRKLMVHGVSLALTGRVLNEQLQG